MDWISRQIIVAAINSAGDTLTVEEAIEIVKLYGSKAEWVFEPPSWLDYINKYNRRFVEQCQERLREGYLS